MLIQHMYTIYIFNNQLLAHWPVDHFNPNYLYYASVTIQLVHYFSSITH